ncbi:MAG TPA: helix-turn-helix domain-containing protein [Gaiellaceae bacterium]|jgi:transcriptional regulator with XRE-family HTH domain|nr:helix-turn-helix domain-containing protein [Gaiellaceae bacterium]
MQNEGVALLAAWMAEDASKRTQTYVASMLGVKQPSVSQWLRGVSRPEAPQRTGLLMLAGIPEESWLQPNERAAIEATRERIGKTGTDGES